MLCRAGPEEPESCRQSVDPGHSLGPGLLVLAFLGGCTITGGCRQFSGGQKLMALPSGALVWRSFSARLSPVPRPFCPFSETTISGVSSPRIFSRPCDQFFHFPLLGPIISTVSIAKISHYQEDLRNQVVIENSSSFVEIHRPFFHFSFLVGSLSGLRQCRPPTCKKRVIHMTLETIHIELTPMFF